ncbi:hypothetical protein FIBSPDRAFT_900474 [Athelia psychrophila]|uniref:Secreted protein n=1 Tax=Athelia psychrophila TaxID=1759441 RepID=A0A165YDW1_9AGAM|nr:hypothetical protein FIBSPDRAFT_900474 [Fibularhizoctonia sp. CBS 109695]
MLGLGLMGGVLLLGLELMVPLRVCQKGWKAAGAAGTHQPHTCPVVTVTHNPSTSHCHHVIIFLILSVNWDTTPLLYGKIHRPPPTAPTRKVATKCGQNCVLWSWQQVLYYDMSCGQGIHTQWRQTKAFWEQYSLSAYEFRPQHGGRTSGCLS